jgi:hypothetical protein
MNDLHGCRQLVVWRYDRFWPIDGSHHCKPMSATAAYPVFSVGHEATGYRRNAQVGPIFRDYFHDRRTNALVELARVGWRCECSDRNRAQ